MWMCKKSWQVLQVDISRECFVRSWEKAMGYSNTHIVNWANVWYSDRQNLHRKRKVTQTDWFYGTQQTWRKVLKLITKSSVWSVDWKRHQPNRLRNLTNEHNK